MNKYYSKTNFNYNENDFSINRKKTDLNIEFNRVAFIFFVFFTIYLIYSIHLLYLGSKASKVSNKNLSESINPLHRTTIIDINGNYLAKTVSSTDIGISPIEAINKEKLLLNLKYIFPKKNFNEIEKKLKINKFFWIEKRVSDEKYEQLMKLGDKSIIAEKKIIRIYPQKNLFSHIIGQIDSDNNGISGLEKSQNEILKNSKLPIQLTLDSDLQFLIRQELLKFNTIFKTKGSGAVLMDINNGEVLTLISLPDFDPNQREKIVDKNFINRITKGVYELGSVFKTFTLAAALKNKVINSETMFKNLENKISCAGREISEHDELPKNLSAEQILIRSSNIGAIRIAQRVGIEKYKSFLNSLKLFKTINFDLEEVGTPLPFKWGKCKLATASFGHGITTTPLQLARAYAILGNGGYEIQPTILQLKKSQGQKKQIISQKTSTTINKMLRKVVANKEGTANFANIKGYEVGGKTGTALKSFNGVYTNKKLNTFVSLFPTSRPKYVLLVVLDEPKSAPDFIYEFQNGYKHKGEKRNTSGWNTVVVTGKIIEKIGPILAIKNLQAFNNF